MILKNNLPVYSIIVDAEQDLEVNCVSIVGTPAMESNFLKFSNNPRVNKILTFNGDDKMELLGVALIPDLPIYRNVDGKEFYVVFSRETIKQIAQNLFKKGYNTSMNVEHSEEDAESYIYQSFIVDEDLGIRPPEGLGALPEGTWLIGVKVESEELWNDIKAGVRNGFSVEGLFGLIDMEEELEELIEETEEEDALYEEIEELKELADKYSKLFSKVK